MDPSKLMLYFGKRGMTTEVRWKRVEEMKERKGSRR
jgi:hypothetical protein